MSTFYYNRFSGDSCLSQWQKHLQNQEYVENIAKSINNSSSDLQLNINNVISNQTSEINKVIQNSSEDQIKAIGQSTNAICGTLNWGFSLLSENLSEISFGIDSLRSEVNNMASMLDWKLSLVIEQQNISNLLLGNIAELLRIPDIQKERQYYIEQGLKFLNNAIFDKDFFEDALKNLLKAEIIEPTDFFTLHRIGIIHLNSIQHLDLELATKYFKKAAKYAVAETNIGTIGTHNHLESDLFLHFNGQKISIDKKKIQAAESFLLAGRSTYLQENYNESAELSENAFKLVPQLAEAGYTQSKALVANKMEEKAVEVLKKVIEVDRFYTLKIVCDPELATNTSVISYLNILSNDTNTRANAMFEICKKNQIKGSTATTYMIEIKNLLLKNNFLSAMKAIDLITKINTWKFAEPNRNELQKDYYISLSKILDVVNNLEYYKEGKRFYDAGSAFKREFMDKLSRESQWNFQDNKSHSFEGTLFTFLEREKELHNKYPIVIDKYTEYVNQLKDDNLSRQNHFIQQKQNVDDANFNESCKKGFLNALTGLFYGVITSGILQIFFTEKYDAFVFVFTTIIFIVIYFYNAFELHRRNIKNK